MSLLRWTINYSRYVTLSRFSATMIFVCCGVWIHEILDDGLTIPNLHDVLGRRSPYSRHDASSQIGIIRSGLNVISPRPPMKIMTCTAMQVNIPLRRISPRFFFSVACGYFVNASILTFPFPSALCSMLLITERREASGARGVWSDFPPLHDVVTLRSYLARFSSRYLVGLVSSFIGVPRPLSLCFSKRL